MLRLSSIVVLMVSIYSPVLFALDTQAQFLTEVRKFNLRSDTDSNLYQDQESKSVLNFNASHFAFDSQIIFEGGVRYFDQMKRSRDTLESYHNELYLDRYFGNHLVSFGRKKVRWGVGYIASPVDIVSIPVTPFNQEDRFYNIEGRDMFQYSWLGATSSIDLMLVKGNDASTNIATDALYSRFYINYKNIDYALVSGFSTKDDGYVIGANAAGTFGQSLELHVELSYDSKVHSRTPQIDEQGAFHFQDETQIKGLLGGQWSSENGFNIIFEYLYLENGISNREVDAAISQLRLLSSASLDDSQFSLLQTQYVFLRFSKNEFAGDLDSSFLVFSSLENGSMIYKLEVNRELDSGFNLYGEIYSFDAASNEEFSLSQRDYGMYLGFKYSF